jgi:Domain of unknown function (DUF397)
MDYFRRYAAMNGSDRPMSDRTWRKSSHSDEDNCLELAGAAVRDSKNPDGTVLLVDVTALVAAVKAGQIA